MTVPEENWIVEWTYSPADYFEEPMEIPHEDYKLMIKDGKVEAITKHNPQPELCDQLSMELECRFQGVQLVSHEPFELSAPSVSCRHSNGKHTLSVKVSDGIRISDHVDLMITNKNGSIVADTRAERIERKQFLGNLAVKYGSSDPLARELLLNYNKAMNDSNHFLSHLYDNIDTLIRDFGREQKARAKLQITKAQWSELSKLANKAPLREGRHRGLAKREELRNATKDERDTAMNIAADIVEKYLKYLDEQRT